MSSQINVDTIVDKAGSGGTNVKIGNTSTYVAENSTTTQNTVQSLAKVWVIGNTSATIQDSVNVSSSTDVGTGNFSYVFTNAMRSDEFSSPFTGAQDQANYVYSPGRAAGSNTIKTVNSSGSVQDSWHSGTIHGDLA